METKGMVHGQVRILLFAFYEAVILPLRREEVIMVNRILRDDPYKSSMHNREGLGLTQIWKAIKDWGSYPLYIIGLLHLSSSASF